MLKFVQNATHSSQESRNWLIPADELTDSKSVSVWTNNFYIVIVEAALSAAFLTFVCKFILRRCTIGKGL